MFVNDNNADLISSVEDFLENFIIEIQKKNDPNYAENVEKYVRNYTDLSGCRSPLNRKREYLRFYSKNIAQIPHEAYPNQFSCLQKHNGLVSETLYSNKHDQNE